VRDGLLDRVCGRLVDDRGADNLLATNHGTTDLAEPAEEQVALQGPRRNALHLGSLLGRRHPIDASDPT
jgi:hypothetical protein